VRGIVAKHRAYDRSVVAASPFKLLGDELSLWRVVTPGKPRANLGGDVAAGTERMAAQRTLHIHGLAALRLVGCPRKRLATGNVGHGVPTGVLEKHRVVAWGNVGSRVAVLHACGDAGGGGEVRADVMPRARPGCTGFQMARH
jgi:hypothetical protein